ncbi:hypothetical protein Aduo_009319 [Ancylostoma duodenale]
MVIDEPRHSQFFTFLQELRADGKFCDVELLVGDQSIKSHRLVLLSSIPYFRTMFTTDMKESKQKQIRMPWGHEERSVSVIISYISVPAPSVDSQIDFSALSSLISYAYGCPLTINGQNVQAVMMTANYFELQSVTEKCATFICEHLLDVDNALSLRTIFLSVKCRSAAEEVDRFVEKNFALISYSDKFLELSTEDVVELLSKDELNVASEEEAFNAAMRWIEHSPERTNVLERATITPSVLHQLNDKLVDKVARHPSVLCSSRCREMVDEVKDFHLVRGRKPKSSLHTRPRRYNASGFAIIVVGGRRNGQLLSDVQKYDPVKKQWTNMNAMYSYRAAHGVAVDGGNIYTVGGEGFPSVARVTRAVETVEVYHSVEKKWKKMPSFKKPRFFPSVAFLDKDLYICGGMTKHGECTNDVEVYNITSQTLTVGVPMSNYRAGAGIAAVDGYIYVMGGRDVYGNEKSSVESFTPGVRAWEKIPDMKRTRAFFGATVMNGKIYVCGGTSGAVAISDVECFDPKTLKWSAVAKMLAPVKSGAVVSHGGEVYWECSSTSCGQECSYVQIYREETGSWEFGTYLDRARTGAAAAVVVTR